MSDLLEIVKQHGVWIGLALFFWWQQFQDKKSLQAVMDEHYKETKIKINALEKFQQEKMVEILNDYNNAIDQCNQTMKQTNEIMQDNSKSMRRICDVIAIQNAAQNVNQSNQHV